MAVFRSFDDLAKGFASASKNLNGEELQRIVRRIARESQKLAKEEVQRDLGEDEKFSGWSATLATTLKDQAGNPGAVMMQPTRRSAGPWTVLNDGRNQGNALGFAGPGINRSTGETARTKKGKVRATRARKLKRWNGTTQGKGTADRAVARIEELTLKRAEEEVDKAFKKHFD